jgi:glucose/arabinose dehydrogenase
MRRAHRRPRPRAGGARTGGLAAALLAAALLAGACSPGGAAPNWQPQQPLSNAPLPHPLLNAPGPGAGQGQGGTDSPPPDPPSGAAPTPPPDGSTPPPGAPTPQPSGSDAVDPAVLATNLASPTGEAMLPDGTALVGERTTGRIVKVQPVAGQPVTQVAQLDGIDASGDGGLLDLALSPSYAQDGLVLAYITTATDNRVVHFALGGVATPIITGLPRGATGNAGRIAFDSAGHLYVATGDAGNPAAPADPASLAGKILRTDDLGRPLGDNPSPSSPVWARGPDNVRGLCLDPADDSVFAIAAGGGVYRATRDAVLAPTGGTAPIATVPDTWAQLGGCAVANRALYIATGDGKALISASLEASSGPIGDFSAVLSGKYGRLCTVIAAPDGALWLTTDNLPPNGSAPDPTDDRVVRILDSAGGGSSVL